jgi:hypothetical protein
MAQTPHLTPETIERYHQRRLTPEELLALDDHVSECEACRFQLAKVEEKQEVFSFLRADLQAEAETGPTCLSYEQLVAYVDHTMGEVDREIAESHLEICVQCEQEVSDLRAFKGLMSTYPAQEHAPAVSPTWQERWKTFLSRPFVALPLGAASVGAAAMVIFWMTTSPLQRELSNLHQQVAQERREKDALKGQVAAVPALKSQAEQFRQLSAQARQENQRLRQENQTLQAKVNRPVPPPLLHPKIPDKGRPAGGGNRPFPIRPSHPGPSEGAQLALNDGGRQPMLDPSGRLVRVLPYPPVVQNAWRTGKLSVPSDEVFGRGGVLMGGPEEEDTFTVRGPVGTVIESDRPTLTWSPMPDADGYKVYLFEDRSPAASEESEVVKETQWTIPRALNRGRIYRWEVVALKDGDEIAKAPRPPSPDARFKVLDADKALELINAQKVFGNSHLTMGTLYAHDGLLQDAEREFQALVKENPKNRTALKLLRQIQAPLRKRSE